jgi:hypothetical protein
MMEKINNDAFNGHTLGFGHKMAILTLCEMPR